MAAVLAACGGEAETCADCEGGQGGSLSCEIDPPGAAFTFRIENSGTRALRLAYGCGEALPIELDTPEGLRGIGAGSGDLCEISCDQVYAGSPNNGCSDCGPGYGAALPPGATETIAWDRRVYVAHQAPEACSGVPGGNPCALGIAVDPMEVTSGVLTVCTDDGSGGILASCVSEEQVPFAVDLSTDELLIQVQ